MTRAEMEQLAVLVADELERRGFGSARSRRRARIDAKVSDEKTLESMGLRRPR